MPAKQLISLAGVSKRDQGVVSPSKSSFTFSEEDQPYAMSTPPSINESPIARDTAQTTPAEFSATSSVAGSLRHELGRKRSIQSILPFREPLFSAREKVHKDSVILAEVKTNVIVCCLSKTADHTLTIGFVQIRDEFMFLNEFSQHLAQRYQKPTSSIFITLDHSACLLYASSFDSAYILTITALPSQILSSTNKRNAALIQSFMTSSLGVLPDRGVVKFVGLPEEYLATSGRTLQAHTEVLERVINDERKPPDMPLPQPPPIMQQPPPRRPNSQRRKPPALSLVPKSQSMPGSRMPSPPTTAQDSPVIPTIPLPKSQAPSMMDRKAERMQKSGKRRSIMALFGRG